MVLTVILLVGVVLSWGAVRHNQQQHHLQRQLHCLALNIYHEARGEPDVGQQAVAEVTLNRMRSPFYPATICEVVYQKGWDRKRKRYVGAFSWTEQEDPAVTDDAAWRQSQQLANDMYYGRKSPIAKGALFFHAKHINPNWAQGKSETTRIGQHIFYR